MEGDELGAEEVLAVGEAGGDGDAVEAGVGDHIDYSPTVGCGVVTLFLNFKPAVPYSGVGGGIVDFLEVGDCWALVRGIDYIDLVVLRSAL